MEKLFYSDSEVARLKRLIIHSPDSGLGKVVPSKAQDWLFEDIVHLETMRKKEYDLYLLLLLYFLDPDKVKGKIMDDSILQNREFFKPGHANYFKSDKVLEFEVLLSEILTDFTVKNQLIAAVSAVEDCSYQEMKNFMEFGAVQLAKILITGTTEKGEMFFPPIPNLIFTRDLGIMINDHLLLNKPAKLARTRESLLAKYVFFNHSLFNSLRDNIIEIEEDEDHFLLPEDVQGTRLETLEGGDVMMVAPNHLFIGISERTSLEGARQAMRKLFDKGVLEKVTLIKIPAKRDYMHIDTIFTQIKENVWVLLGSLARAREFAMKEKIWDNLGQRAKSEELIIKQFSIAEGEEKVRTFENLEDLLISVSKEDLKCEENVKFIYSGNNEFPYGAREQWTDSCNLLVLKSGVAVGYDRNDKTAQAFVEEGFDIIPVKELLLAFEKGLKTPEKLENTIITLPSAELSRARGGSHCMSMPLLRDNIF